MGGSGKEEMRWREGGGVERGIHTSVFEKSCLI